MTFLLLLTATLSASLLLQAETHRFQPQRYWREFTPYAEPALRIKPGDVVLTTSVDSEGVDEKGRRVTPGWNPLTGPFYVDGAEPGDTLGVVLEQIRLNRSTGLASTRISDDAVTPQYIRKQFRDKVSPRGITWTFDDERKSGRTDFSERLRAFRLPLRPFLGCLGVAPAMAEAQHSITADSHGGNMDYNRLTEGVTVYFPVNVRGAYLFLGDAHAAQGDGETSGGAIETTAEVQFRVLLQKKKPIPAVRAESADEYIALGMARPLEDAARLAVTNMLGWLTTDFGFTAEEAHVLLGTSARFDLVSLVSPRNQVVACKLPKKLLQDLTPGAKPQ